MENLTIKTILRENWNEVLKLQVSDEQARFIESSKHCLNDANTDAYDMKWSFYGIYYNENLVGFAMHGREYYNHPPFSRVWLDRFMIDERYQGRGFGRHSLVMILEKMFSDYSCEEVFLSVYDKNKVAIKLYSKIGFKECDFRDIGGDTVMVIEKGI